MDAAPVVDAALLARLEHLDLAIRRLAHGAQPGDHSAARRGAGLLFREHRAYSVGDDPRRLDWNVYLRLGELLVKEHEAEEAPRLLLVLDRSASMALEPRPKFAVALELMVCMAAIALMRRVVVTCCESPPVAEPATFSSRASLPALLARAQSTQAGTGESRVGLEALAGVLPGARRSGLAVLFTDLYDDGLDSLVRFIASRQTEVHVVHLRNPEDLTPPLGADVRLQDAESHEELRACIDSDVRDSWRETLEEHFALRTEKLTALGASVSAFDIAAGAEGILLQLARRGVLVH
ncbi:MAG: DUF58 domain-containing protein [Planctomycetes bacterium]|nr:DUF58 domain-containing protein [Planctomycetota bacterium]